MVWCKVVIGGPGGHAENVFEKLPCITQFEAKRLLETRYPGYQVRSFVYFSNGNNPPKW